MIPLKSDTGCNSVATRAITAVLFGLAIAIVTTPVEIYSFIQNYAIENKIGADAKLFDITERQVQRHLNKVFTKMGLPLRNYGSHSYRKYFSQKVYIENGYNIELVRVLLQHSSVAITQKYIGISQKQVEEALAGTVANLV